MSTQTTTLLKSSSTATYICEQGKPPVITPGKLTPDLLFDFENGTYSYFSFKDVKPEKEVSKIAGGLQDGHIQMWYHLNCAAVDAAGFTAFTKHIRDSWLKPGWEQEVKLVILTSHQGNSAISDWIMLLESTNTLLNDHVCKLSDNDLRNHIQSHVHPDTMTATTTAELHLIASYDKYKQLLKVVDDTRIRADNLLRAAVKQMMAQSVSVRHAAIACHNASPYPSASGSSSTTAINTSTPRTPDRLPALTLTEHSLLVEHDGCFKCHHFYVNHKLPNCLDGFPDKNVYMTLTEVEALIAKKHHVKKEKTTVAVIMPTTPIVPTAVVMPSAVLGEGSDSEYVTTPFFVPHFFFNCLVGGSTALSQLPVHALIDHGSDSVLIDLLLTDHLHLRRRKLPLRKEVVMAIGDGKKVFSLDEWVPITIISVDQSWTSRTCRAILAPNLSVPLLFGGPFLSLNSLVIDHELRTCIDKKCGFDLLNPVPIRRSVVKPKPRFSPELAKLQKSVIADIKTLFPQTMAGLDNSTAVAAPCPIAAVRTRIEQIVSD
jgi:hypothetical protein